MVSILAGTSRVLWIAQQEVLMSPALSPPRLGAKCISSEISLSFSSSWDQLTSVVIFKLNTTRLLPCTACTSAVPRSFVKDKSSLSCDLEA